jgi:hypothetical protein
MGSSMQFVVPLVVIAFTCFHVSGSGRPSWWSCVRDIGLYFEPSSDSMFEWGLNPCGFTSLQVEDVRRSIYFAKDNATIAFAGDSTALRAYVYAVNTYLPPLSIPVIRKVATVPRVMTHVAFGNYDGENRKALATFFNMRYVSTSQREIEEGILHADGGVMVITLGNWDLNWKLQRNSPMPHLKGAVHNFEVAKAYWTEHVAAMMGTIARCLALQTSSKRPLIVFREQFLPNCDASRFTSKKSRYRRCAPLIRPIVVPLYRRVLAPLAWAMNIPVIPMDHVFKEGYKYCAMGDGIHLDFNCMMTEQQHIWNVVLLMKRHLVHQGLGTVSHEGDGLPNTRLFLNVSRYEEWQREFDMSAPKVLARDRKAAAQHKTTHNNESIVEETHLNATGQPSHDGVAVGDPPPAEIALTVLVTDRAPGPQDAQHHIQLTLQLHQWGHFIFSSILLVAVALYFWWAASGPREEWGALIRLE